MSALETIDASNWEDFLSAPKALLMLGKSDCDACHQWTEELNTWLASEDASEHADVRFGKLLLDQRGLIDFKKANSWLAEVTVLPFNALYQGGEKKKDFAGSGIERMTNRLARLD